MVVQICAAINTNAKFVDALTLRLHIQIVLTQHTHTDDFFHSIFRFWLQSTMLGCCLFASFFSSFLSKSCHFIVSYKSNVQFIRYDRHTDSRNAETVA